STDVPFCLIGLVTLNTRQEFDQMLGQAIQQAPPQQIEFAPLRLIPLDDYLKTQGGQKVKDFLGKMPRSEVRIVYLTAKQAGRDETGALIIRARGGRAHVIGLGEAK